MRAPAFPGAERFVPPNVTIGTLPNALDACRGCDLYRLATRAVGGAGPKQARLMLVGEQPGNEEDLAGAPFVGPAGRLLDRALAEAGINRSEVYVTNAVKHFKFEERGKRRIHKKPGAGEVRACHPWLEAEMELVRPRIIGCLGATAALSVLGRDFRLTQNRGREVRLTGTLGAVATIHPSAILRSPTSEEREAAFAGFVSDLKVMRSLVHP
jgi:DNA polymerase